MEVKNYDPNIEVPEMPKSFTPLVHGSHRGFNPGHGFWIESNVSFSNKKAQYCHCSVCGSANKRPIGEYCRWCGARMDQDPLCLASKESLPDLDISRSATTTDKDAEYVYHDAKEMNNDLNECVSAYKEYRNFNKVKEASK